MNSWKGHNYYTQNNTKWVELMNLSTAEWGVGWLPANLVAIPQTLNNTIASQYPPNTTFIEDAAKATTGDRDTEKIVFGVTSGIVLLWAVSWLIYSWKTEKLGKPPAEHRRYAPIPRANNDSPSDNAGAVRLDEPHSMSVDEFKKNLNKYYDPVKTELEICDEAKAGRLEGKDVEAVTNLLRQMYDLDLGLWSLRDTIPGETDEVEREKYRIRSEAIWNEVRETVYEWERRLNQGSMGLDQRERQQMNAIVELFRQPQYQKPRYTLQQ